MTVTTFMLFAVWMVKKADDWTVLDGAWTVAIAGDSQGRDPMVWRIEALHNRVGNNGLLTFPNYSTLSTNSFVHVQVINLTLDHSDRVKVYPIEVVIELHVDWLMYSTGGGSLLGLARPRHPATHMQLRRVILSLPTTHNATDCVRISCTSSCMKAISSVL